MREESLRRAFEEHSRMQKQKRVELYEASFTAELEEYRRRRETEVSSLYTGKAALCASRLSYTNSCIPR